MFLSISNLKHLISLQKFRTMKNLVVLFLLAFAGLQAQTNQTDSEGRKHGLWKGVYPESKRPKYEGTFEHGKEVGVFKFFDDTKAGTVIATRDFSRQPGAAYTTFYDQRNNKVSEGNVVGKQYEGKWIYYHRQSPTIMATEFYKKGQLDGVRQVFYPDGKLAEETTYVAGVKSGLYKKYAQTGTVLEEVTYVNGELEGPAIYRNPDGKIMSKGNYKKGAKHGMWTITEDGKTRQQKFPIRGKQSQKK